MSYIEEDPEDLALTLSFDLISRGVEITTVGQCIHDYDEIVEKMFKRGDEPNKFEFFTTAHKYGLFPYEGLGLGLERISQRLLNFDNIKSTTMFPGDISRIIS